MSDAYSKSETDAKLALVEERLDHKFDRLLAEIKEGFHTIDAAIDKRFTEMDTRLQNMDNRFNLVDKDMNWIKFAMAGFVIPLSIAVVSLYVTVLTHR